MSEGLLERWTKRWRTPAVEASPVDVAAPAGAEAEAPPREVPIDLEAAMAAEFPAEFPVAAEVTRAVIGPLQDADLSSLARRSPSLRGYQWATYLRCSICRVVRMQRALRTHLPSSGRILDYGSYFGNFALAARATGFSVDAVDSYRGYAGALDPWVRLQHDAGIAVHDFGDIGFDLAPLSGVFDGVICAGVIEHMPHTPRPLLETLNRALKPGGILVLDTPNLAYLYRRLALLDGRSIFAPIHEQYYTDLPFEGHHREYTIDELKWILRAANHELLDFDTFNYSMFGGGTLTGEHAEHYHAMVADPSLREVMMSVSRRLPETS